jgi:hypothetical protein
VIKRVFTHMAKICRALSYAPDGVINEYRRFTERRATPSRDEFPKEHIGAASFCGLIDLSAQSRRPITDRPSKRLSSPSVTRVKRCPDALHRIAPEAFMIAG